MRGAPLLLIVLCAVPLRAEEPRVYGEGGPLVVVSAGASDAVREVARSFAERRKGILLTTEKKTVAEIGDAIRAVKKGHAFDRMLLLGSPARIPHLVVTYQGEPCFTDMPYEDTDQDGDPDVASARIYDTWPVERIQAALEGTGERSRDGVALDIGPGGKEPRRTFKELAERCGFTKLDYAGTTAETMEKVRHAVFIEAFGGHSGPYDIDLGNGVNKFLVKDLPALEGRPFFMMPICSPADARVKENWPATLFERGAAGFLGSTGVTMAWHSHSPASWFYFDNLMKRVTKGEPVSRSLLEAKRAHIASFPKMKERIAFAYKEDCEPKHYVEDPDTYTVLEFMFFGDPDLRF